MENTESKVSEKKCRQKGTIGILLDNVEPEIKLEVSDLALWIERNRNESTHK